MQALDVAAWDAWVAQLGRGESWVVRAQQNWRGVALALVLLLAATAALYQWGLPWVARGVTAAVPTSVDAMIGAEVLASIDQSLLAAQRAAARRAGAPAPRLRADGAGGPPGTARRPGSWSSGAPATSSWAPMRWRCRAAPSS